MNEEKMDELLRLMRAVVPDTSEMSDAGRIGFVYRQNYDPEAQYEKLDVVKFGMSLWTPKAVTIGNSPPDQSQEGQENVEENEFWKMFLPGALGSDYVKKTDLSKPPTETEAGKPGINFPDGKTIQMDENGMLTGTPLDFSGTWDELFAGIDSGEVKDGMVGYVKGTKSDPDNPNHPNNLLLEFDDYLSLYSSNAPQNRIVTAMLNQIKALAEQNAQLIEDVKELRARTDTYGLSKICPVDVTDITEANGMVLGGWEKNAAKAGTLANGIQELRDRAEWKTICENVAKSDVPNFNTYIQKGAREFYVLISDGYYAYSKVFASIDRSFFEQQSYGLNQTCVWSFALWPAAGEQLKIEMMKKEGLDFDPNNARLFVYYR